MSWMRECRLLPARLQQHWPDWRSQRVLARSRTALCRGNQRLCVNDVDEVDAGGGLGVEASLVKELVELRMTTKKTFLHQLQSRLLRIDRTLLPSRPLSGWRLRGR